MRLKSKLFELSLLVCLCLGRQSAFSATKAMCVSLFESSETQWQVSLLNRIDQSLMGKLLKTTVVPDGTSVEKRAEVFQKAALLEAQGALRENLDIETQYQEFIEQSMADSAVMQAVVNGSKDPETLAKAEIIRKKYDKHTDSFIGLGGLSGKLGNLPSLRLKASNERFEIFTEALKGKMSGGTYVGLAHNQNYDLIAMTSPQHVVLYDYDVAPIVTHLIVRVALLHSKTPEEFLQFFSPENMTHSSHLLQTAYKNESVTQFFEYQVFANDGMTTSWNRYFKNNQFLSTQVLFENVRKPFMEGRVLLINDDNNGDTFNRIADYVLQMKSQVTTLYVSNSFETRWTSRFTDTLRRGLSRMPIAKESLVLLTSIDHDPISKSRVGLTEAVRPIGQAISGGLLSIEYYIVGMKSFIDTILKSN